MRNRLKALPTVALGHLPQEVTHVDVALVWRHADRAQVAVDAVA